MKIEEIRAEAVKYHTGWGDDRDNAPVKAFELGAKWAYNRALEDAVGKLNEQAIPYIELGIDSVKKLKL